MSVSLVIKLLSLLTLFGNLFLVLVIIIFMSAHLIKSVRVYRLKMVSFLAKRSLLFSFAVSLAATLGSLYFSEVAKFTPCILCWYQRILMYPLPLLLGIALYKRTEDVRKYVLPFSLIGLVIASYHYSLQIFPQKLVPCSTTGFSVSCSDRFITYFGFITIPFMSLTAFSLIFLFMLIGRIRNNN